MKFLTKILKYILKIILKYWDIITGLFLGLVVAATTQFNLEKIQLIYSIFILMLVSIGCFRIIKQSIEKNKKIKRNNIIDALVDTQKPIKALNLAQDPSKEGQKLGEAILNFLKGAKIIMKKIKEFFTKFKGFILALALAILSIVEMCGGFINEMLGDALVINGVKIIPLITIVAATIVGCISNGYTKEQRDKIKALFSKSTTNELVTAEIKKTLKENETKLKEFNKVLLTQENALANLESQLVTAKNTHNAKVEMFNMKPQLATEEDVQLAANEKVNIEAAINEKKQEISKTKASIEKITLTISALKEQL